MVVPVVSRPFALVFTLVFIAASFVITPEARAGPTIQFYDDVDVFEAATGARQAVFFDPPTAGGWRDEYTENGVRFQLSARGDWITGDYLPEIPGNEYRFGRGIEEIFIWLGPSTHVAGMWIYDSVTAGSSCRESNFRFHLTDGYSTSVATFSVDPPDDGAIFVGFHTTARFNRIIINDWEIQDCRDAYGGIWLPTSGDGSTLPPPPSSPLLQHLNVNHPFHWGSEFPEDDVGAAVAPPTSRSAIDEARDEGNYPVWFADPPKSFVCCSTIAFDRNTLKGGADLSIEVADFLNKVPLDAARDFVEDLDDLVSAEASYAGIRLHDLYETGGTEQTTVFSGAEVDLSTAPGGGGGLGQLHGTAQLDANGEVLEVVGVQSFDLTAHFDGPGIDEEYEFERDLSFKFLGYKVPVSFEAELAVELETELAAGIGMGFRAEGLRPAYVLVGVQAGAEGSARLEGDLEVTDAAELEVLLGASASAQIAGEVLVPIKAGTAVRDAHKSALTQVVYRDLDSLTAVLLIGPIFFDVEPVVFDIEIFGFEYDLELGDGGAWTFGPWVLAYADGRVDAGFGRTVGVGGSGPGSAASLLGGAAERFEVLPAEDGLLRLEVQGTPGTSKPFAFSRSFAALLANGTTEATTWSYHVPSLTLGSDGHASFLLDVHAIEARAAAAVNETITLDDALAASLLEVDLDGNGLADMVEGVLHDDDRAALGLAVTVADSDGKNGTAHRGEPVHVHVEARNEATRTTDTTFSGTVEVLMGSTSMGTVDLSQGIGSAALVVPNDATTGNTTIQARFAGDGTHRMSTGWTKLELLDRAPSIFDTSPELFHIIDPAEGTVHALTLTTNAPTDLDLASSVLVVGGTSLAWTDLGAGQLQAWFDLDTLAEPTTDGFLWAEITLADLAGNLQEAAFPFVIDAHAPEVTFDGPPVRMAGSSSPPITWTANEPVTLKAHWTSRGDANGTTFTRQSEPFTTSGTVASDDIPPGVYTVSFEVRDTAGRGRFGEVLLPEFVVIVV